jgi:DHA2 family multidrug resistance protein
MVVENIYERWMITLTVILASLLELIDTTIVNVSLFQIMGNLGATLSEASWIVTGYGIANVIVLPMSAWLAVRFGRRNYLLASIIIFTIASFACGNATSMTELIIFRIIQGLAGGGLLTTAQTILAESWPKEQLGMAMAMFGLGVVVGPTVGPTIGGYITDNFSWPWIFYVNIPVGILATLLVIRFIEPSKPEKDKSVDWLGIILLAFGIGSLQYILEKGDSKEWFEDKTISILALGSAVSLISFCWRELTTSNPIINLRILKDRDLSLGLVNSFILGFGLYASVFVLPILCQNLLGMTPYQTGIMLFPGGLVTIFMMPFVGVLLKNNFSPHILAVTGIILCFWFCYDLSLTTSVSGQHDFFWPLIIRGVSLSLLFVPLSSLSLSSLTGKAIGEGSALNNMSRQLGGAFGIAIVTTIINKRVALHYSHLVENVNQFNPAMQERLMTYVKGFMSKGYDYPTAQKLALKAIDGLSLRETYILSYTDVFYMVGLIMFIAIPFILMHTYRKNYNLPMDAH